LNLAIIKYNAGNIQSVLYALERIGIEATVTDNVEAIRKADKVIFPGVGEASTAMNYLKERKLDRVIKNLQQPVLGICLGMQLMCKGSEEGVLPGLGWFDADVKRFRIPEGSPFKIPHMGWNAVQVKKDNPLIEKKEEEQRFYFVHSYHAVCNNPQDELLSAVHDYEFTAAISHDNIYATQFHPEKSHRFGMELLKHFIAL